MLGKVKDKEKLGSQAGGLPLKKPCSGSPLRTGRPAKASSQGQAFSQNKFDPLTPLRNDTYGIHSLASDGG